MSLSSSFNFNLSWLAFSFEVFSCRTNLSFNSSSLFYLFIFSFNSCSFEVLKLQSSFNVSFASCHSANVTAPSPPPALSVSVSCNTSLANLTLLQAVHQHLCSSNFNLEQGTGSTLASPFLQKLLWRHNVTFLSRSFFNISSLSLP